MSTAPRRPNYLLWLGITLIIFRMVGLIHWPLLWVFFPIIILGLGVVTFLASGLFAAAVVRSLHGKRHRLPRSLLSVGVV